MLEVAVTAFPSAVQKAGVLKICDELSDLARHYGINMTLPPSGKANLANPIRAAPRARLAAKNPFPGALNLKADLGQSRWPWSQRQAAN